MRPIGAWNRFPHGSQGSKGNKGRINPSLAPGNKTHQPTSSRTRGRRKQEKRNLPAALHTWPDAIRPRKKSVKIKPHERTKQTSTWRPQLAPARPAGLDTAPASARGGEPRSKPNPTHLEAAAPPHDRWGQTGTSTEIEKNQQGRSAEQGREGEGWR